MGGADDGTWWDGLGSAIRARRLSRSLSLVDLASTADLSQPFLSQVENGRARPSLLSLRRIADALGTTPQALFEASAEAPAEPAVVRAAEVPAVPVDGSDSGICRLLVSGDRPLHLLEFEGLPTAYLDYFEHEGFELIHVTGGCVEVDIDGSFTTLGPGDSMTYSSRQPHRFRSIGPDVARLMLFETTPARAAAAQDATTAVDRRLRHVEAAP